MKTFFFELHGKLKAEDEEAAQCMLYDLFHENCIDWWTDSITEEE